MDLIGFNSFDSIWISFSIKSITSLISFEGLFDELELFSLNTGALGRSLGVEASSSVVTLSVSNN